MAEPGTELFEAIRRDHRAGDRLPSSLAARHGVSRQTVMEAISAVLPLPHSLPADEEELDEIRQLLDVLLEEDQATTPGEQCSAFAV
ncbi:GntR family transcriptional regulator [Streptomyces sp. SBST2-5]|uniref:GntR family transcriptional regulator n=1 Tax=Streptomyces composti TaxID=2720025 RepID=A0ABX1AEV4_9ACTN|nr:GntR family transcriptional regulator [Streptomyces composti]NJP53802.1 GntR family transcriptional regulator [Streptomyces composti]